MECQVCFCEYQASEGVSCTNGHFLCATCLEGYVKAEASPDNISILAKNDGKLKCPYFSGDERCSCPGYGTSAIAKQLPDQAFELWVRARDRAMEQRVSEQVRQGHQAEIRRLQERADAAGSAAGSEEERRAQMRKHVIEKILTLHCPNPACEVAFTEFEGCMALKCNACGTGFCALCLAHCGRDAHSHVAQCQEAAGMMTSSYHASFSVFEEVQKRRRQRLVGEYLDKLEGDRERRLLLKDLNKDLVDLGLDVELLKARGAATKAADEARRKQEQQRMMRGGGRGAGRPRRGGRGGALRLPHQAPAGFPPMPAEFHEMGEMGAVFGFVPDFLAGRRPMLPDLNIVFGDFRERARLAAAQEAQLPAHMAAAAAAAAAPDPLQAQPQRHRAGDHPKVPKADRRAARDRLRKQYEERLEQAKKASLQEPQPRKRRPDHPGERRMPGITLTGAAVGGHAGAAGPPGGRGARVWEPTKRPVEVIDLTGGPSPRPASGAAAAPARPHKRKPAPSPSSQNPAAKAFPVAAEVIIIDDGPE